MQAVILRRKLGVSLDRISGLIVSREGRLFPQEIRIMSPGDIGMRSQPALELVPADLPKDRVERIDGNTAFGVFQIGR